MEATIIYDNIKDKELLKLIDSKLTIYINYIDFNTAKGRKESYRIKSHWGAIKNPFVVINDDENKIMKVFYSDAKGDNAVYQLINFLKND